MYYFYSCSIILRKGTDEPFQKAKWGSSCCCPSQQHHIYRSELTWALFSLRRCSVGLDQPPHTLSLLMNYWCILIPGATRFSPSQSHLHAAGATCLNVSLQQCSAVPGNSHGKGSAQAAPHALWGWQNQVTWGHLCDSGITLAQPCPWAVAALKCASWHTPAQVTSRDMPTWVTPQHMPSLVTSRDPPSPVTPCSSSTPGTTSATMIPDPWGWAQSIFGMVLCSTNIIGHFL